MSKKKCPNCSSHDTKKMVKESVNSAINVTNVVMCSRINVNLQS